MLDLLYRDECKLDEWDVERLRLCILLARISTILVNPPHHEDRFLSYRSFQKMEHVSGHCAEWSGQGKCLEVVTEQRKTKR